MAQAKKKHRRLIESTLEDATTHETVHVRLQVILDRELTPDEQRKARRLVKSYANELLELSRAQNPAVVKEIQEQHRRFWDCFRAVLPEGCPFFMTPVTNLYDNRLPWPWYRVATPIGFILVGWRHSVIAVDWSDTVETAQANELGDPAISSSGWRLHVVSYEAATNLLRAVHRRLREPLVPPPLVPETEDSLQGT